MTDEGGKNFKTALSDARLFELVVEVIHDGFAQSVDSLRALEPINMDDLFDEFTRRSGVSVLTVEGCVSWFRCPLSGATDDERWQFETIVKLKSFSERVSKS